MTKDDSTTEKTRVDGYCDICWGRDGFKRMTLLTCLDCGVAFHRECYGIDHSVKDRTVQCGACLSVGQNFTGRDHTGREHVIKQTHRPTECSLCSVDEGRAYPHPMHPLYDDYGTSGKQIVLPPDMKRGKPYRLAWVHTLCAMSVSSHRRTGGCVFGCDADGEYEDAESEEDMDLETDDETDDDGGEHEHKRKDSSVHHFVFCLKENKDDDESVWTQTIREQQSLKCSLCGANDKNDGVNVSYRIPLQCSANDPGEFKEFDGSHDELCGGTCFVPIHVGCAMWYKNDAGEYPTARRVYFFPGMAKTSDTYAQPVSNIFCDVHALGLQHDKIPGSTTLRYPVTPGRSRTQAGMNVHDREWEPSDQVAGAGAPRANAKAAPMMRAKAAAKVTMARKMPAPKMIRRTSNTKVQSVQHATMTLEEKKRDNELFLKMVQDLVEQFRPLTSDKQRNRVRVARSKYWRGKAKLSSDEFKALWGRVKQRATQLLTTGETITASDETTGEKVRAADSKSRKRKSSTPLEQVSVNYGGLEKHRELGDAMFRKTLTAMENVDTTDADAVKVTMTELRKSSKRNASDLTADEFRELWTRVKLAVADSCGFRYGKPKDKSAEGSEGAAVQASASMGKEDTSIEQPSQSSSPPPAKNEDAHIEQPSQSSPPPPASEDPHIEQPCQSSSPPPARSEDRHGEPVGESSARNSSTNQGKGTVSNDTHTEKKPGPQPVVAERDDTRDIHELQHMVSQVTEVENAKASNTPKEMRVGAVPELKLPDKMASTEASNAPKRRRLSVVSESKVPDYDVNQKEQWYQEMVTGIHEAIVESKGAGVPGALESILAEHKKRWMKKLGIQNSQFRAIWEKVIEKSLSYKTQPIPTTKKDWSFLVVGKNYIAGGIDTTWDTYEDLASQPEG